MIRPCSDTRTLQEDYKINVKNVEIEQREEPEHSVMTKCIKSNDIYMIWYDIRCVQVELYPIYCWLSSWFPNVVPWVKSSRDFLTTIYYNCDTKHVINMFSIYSISLLYRFPNDETNSLPLKILKKPCNIMSEDTEHTCLKTSASDLLCWFIMIPEREVLIHH